MQLDYFVGLEPVPGPGDAGNTHAVMPRANVLVDERDAFCCID